MRGTRAVYVPLAVLSNGGAFVTPLKLSDSQLDQVFRAAHPIGVRDRDAFLRDVAAELRGREIGDGLVARVVREVQARYWQAPEFTRAAGSSKYR